MNENIYLAEKIKVGFNLRADTYTGALGFVIPWDKQKKCWRQERSWEQWREQHQTPEEYLQEKIDSFNNYRKNVEKEWLYSLDFIKKTPKKPLLEKIRDGYWGDIYNQSTLDSWQREKDKSEKSLEQLYKERDCNDLDTYSFNTRKKSNNPALIVQEYENSSLEGFVLNKKAGGYSSGWNHRQTVCRVYDPRGFEFEISVENLLYILEHTNSIVGKGLEGKFMYGWQGKNLVLLPEAAPEFKKMEDFTKLQETNISLKTIQIGSVYITKQNERLLYLGKFPVWEYKSEVCETTKKYKRVWVAINKHCFYDYKNKDYIFKKTCTTLSRLEGPDEDYETHLSELEHHSEINLIDENATVYVPISAEDVVATGYRIIPEVFYFKDGLPENVWYTHDFNRLSEETKENLFTKKLYLTNGKEHKHGSDYFVFTE